MRFTHASVIGQLGVVRNDVRSYLQARPARRLRRYRRGRHLHRASHGVPPGLGGNGRPAGRDAWRGFRRVLAGTECERHHGDPDISRVAVDLGFVSGPTSRLALTLTPVGIFKCGLPLDGLTPVATTSPLNTAGFCCRIESRRVQTAPRLLVLRVPHQSVLSRKGVVLVTGPTGYGKTTFCRSSAASDLLGWKKSGMSGPIPIYVRLGSASLADLSSGNDLLAGGLHTTLMESADWESFRRQGCPVRCYLDGLDEVSDEDGRKKIVSMAHEIARDNPEWLVILTARPYVRGPWLRDVSRVELSGFSISEVEALAFKTLQESEMATHFMNELRASKGLADLVQVPLLAVLMLAVYSGVGSLPAKKAALFATFVDLLSGGWDVAKGINRSSIFGREIKKAVLTRLAYKVHYMRKRRFDRTQFVAAAITAAPGLFQLPSGEAREAQATALLNEIVADGMVVRSGNELMFAHLSLQEFLVGAELAHRFGRAEFDDTVKEFLAGDDWFREVLSFVMGLSPDPEAAFDWITRLDGAGDGLGAGRQEELIVMLQDAHPDFFHPALRVA